MVGCRDQRSSQHIGRSDRLFFKFRERSFGQQQTADAIKKHYKAAELRIGEYEGEDEETALTLFARNVEILKDEQRKRELQLEESTESHETR
ncbi:hypothetical protein GCM10020001_084650 [Nonomuraea salmonea]